MNTRAFAGALLACSLSITSCDGTATVGGDEVDGPAQDEAVASQAVTCSPRMSRFPVNAAHNIGYDAASCGSGTCAISCPDQNANSDYGGAHHGVDVFAFYRAPLVAVAAGTIRAVGVPSSTSGLRVNLSDGCGWWYYYGHMDQAVVSVGQHVEAGQLIGYMGKSGAPSVHTHFNVSGGNYYADIDPFPLLQQTSPTACGGGGGGCTESACNAYGCTCVDGQCGGGFCSGSGCTATETANCAAYGSACVDHQCNGGTSPGTGCTAKETHDCASYGASCVDHQCNGGTAPGSGCTYKETHDCGAYGCGCADHKCGGGACGGTGCTYLETHNCSAYGCGCSLGQCKGGACPN